MTPEERRNIRRGIIGDAIAAIHGGDVGDADWLEKLEQVRKQSRSKALRDELAWAQNSLKIAAKRLSMALDVLDEQDERDGISPF